MNIILAGKDLNVLSPPNAAYEFNSKPRKKLKRNHTTFMFSTADTAQLELRTLIL